ncbi:MAG TPA: TerB family tellurite resistance protein [Candidatus Rifleibacterium sp.]|nr:TerB family tellurite resistance protein [Candidatus Rifleibacterium sp.]
MGIILYGNKISAQVGITCSNCSKASEIAENISKIKKIYRVINLSSQPQIASENLFVDAIAACAAIIIAADGQILKEEVREFKDFCINVFKSKNSFELAGDRLKFYLDNTEKAYASITKLAKLDLTAKKAIFELLFCIAFSDGTCDPKEEEKLRILAGIIKISDTDFADISKKFVSDDQDEFSVLGIGKTKDFSLIKDAYRKKCLEFHPDRYQNLPESFQEFAKKQFQAVQDAFEKLKRRYENV